MILLDRFLADPDLILFNKSDSLWGVAFLLWIGRANKKTPPKAGLFVEHVQESVLVSTLKRCFALLTQIKVRGRKMRLVAPLASLVTGTVPVLRVGRCTG